ncbi:MAG: PucR family transcriptional regulator [Mycobacteriales bacterium]
MTRPVPARFTSIGSPRVNRLLGEMAVRQAADADRIARTMFDAYAAEIPAYAEITDPTLREDIQAVSAAMVRAWLSVLSSGEPLAVESLGSMRQGARRRAAQGIDLHSMLRAYRVGVRVMWTELVADPAWRGQPLQGALVHVAEWALDFADRVATEVAAVYLDELSHVNREREHRRSALLNLILAGPTGESVHGPAELDCPHVVVVGRVDDERPLAQLEHVGDRMQSEAGALFWTVRHRSVVAAVPVGAGVRRAALRARLRPLVPDEQLLAVGLGGVAHGVRETRQSYAEAVGAVQVGPVIGDGDDRIYDYAELAPIIALAAVPETARRFTATALEPLGDLGERAWVYATLEAYLAYQGRAKEAARALGVHPSTLKYRLGELRARSDLVDARGDQAATLLLALKLRRLFEGRPE